MIENIFNFILVISNFGAAFSAASTFMNTRIILIKDTKFKHPILAGHAFLWMLFSLFIFSIVGYSNFTDYIFFKKQDSLGGNYFFLWIAASPLILFSFLMENFFKKYHQIYHTKSIFVKKHFKSMKDKFPAIPDKGFYSLFSKWNHFYDLEILEYSVHLKRIPKEADGFKIAFLSDIHYGRYDHGYLEEIIKITNDMGPDLVLFGGDLVSKEKFIDKAGISLEHLKSKYGKYAVLGNHDYWTNSDKITSVLTDAGFKVLKNEIAEIEINGVKLTMLGIDSPRALIYEAKNLLKSLNGKTPEIILSHNPDHIAGLPIRPKSLILSGHTHGGQIQFPIIGPIMLPSSYNRIFTHGVFNRKGNILIIGKGIGGDPPFRFRCRPELLQITLHSL